MVLVVLGLGIFYVRVVPASTAVSLAWDANTEPDLAGYQIRYGNTSGNYTRMINVGNATSCTVSDLIANTTYYFVVIAYDQAGNVSQPSNEVEITSSIYSLDATENAPPIDAPVSLTAQTASTPTVSSAMELTVKSTYIPRPGVRHIQVTGASFQQGAVLSLGPGIISSPTLFVDARHLKATLTVDPTAPLGPRTLTVTNPDQGSGGLPAALTVVRRSDVRHQRRGLSGPRRPSVPTGRAEEHRPR